MRKNNKLAVWENCEVIIKGEHYRLVEVCKNMIFIYLWGAHNEKANDPWCKWSGRQSTN